MDIVLNYMGKLYIIEREPFETSQDIYIRGWYIVKNYNKYNNFNELVSRSIIYNNLKKQMEYNMVLV